MKQWIFKLKQGLLNGLGVLGNLKFRVHLALLSWHYGGGANIPTDKLPQIFSGDECDKLIFMRTVHACNVLEAICAHYHLDSAETQMGGILSTLLQNTFESEADARAVMLLLNDPEIEVRMFRIMKELEDITPAKLLFFGPPEGHATVEAWLATLKDPRCRYRPTL